MVKHTAEYMLNRSKEPSHVDGVLFRAARDFDLPGTTVYLKFRALESALNYWHRMKLNGYEVFVFVFGVFLLPPGAKLISWARCFRADPAQSTRSQPPPAVFHFRLRTASASGGRRASSEVEVRESGRRGLILRAPFCIREVF